MAQVQTTTVMDAPAVTVAGFTQCVTPGCGLYGSLVDTALVVERVVQRAVDLPVTMTETEHHHVADESDALCSECGNPVAIMREKPPSYRPWR
jgi:hypothetical protein